MIRTFLLLIMAMAGIYGNAAERSVQTLKDIAVKILHHSSYKANAIDGNDSLELLYDCDGIAVIGRNGAGFAVLAKDDAFEPILGYSDGCFNKDDINPNMKWWMECTAKAMAAGITKQSNTIPDGLPQEVESFIMTHWSQGAPYNILCPSYVSNGNSKQYPTGCVATAMAQCMYHFKYPEHGTTTRLYRFNPGDGVEQTVKVVLDDIIFDWNNMLDVYKTNAYDDVQAKAVAELMMACGASVEMEYTVSGSGAQMADAAKALRLYFGYDRGLPFYLRWGVCEAEFNDAIYRNLAVKKPILFGGVSGKGGHAFVLDGYDTEGNVHVNWGWGPNKGDGYFNIALMNGYEEQQAVVPISNDGTYATPKSMICIYQGGLSVDKVDDTHIKVSTNSARLINFGCETYNGNIYVVAMNTETGESKAIATENITGSVAVNYYIGSNGINKSYITIKNKIGDGKYRIFLASKDENEDDYSPVRCREEYTNSYFITVTDGKITEVTADNNPAWMTSTPTGIKGVTTDKNTLFPSSIYSLDGRKLASPSSNVVIMKQGNNVRKVMTR